jgi:hypothetical protein
LVDLVEIQAAYYMVAATGVLVAAVFYILNLRLNQRTLRINMTNSLLQFYTSVEGQRVWIELLNMKWKDYDDFEKKYGSDNNVDNYAKRQAVWNIYNNVGKLLKAGLLDRETIYNSGQTSVVWMWEKFKPIVEEHRRRYSGKDAHAGFEYVAGEMLKMKLASDPSYKVPETFAEYVPSTRSSQ